MRKVRISLTVLFLITITFTYISGDIHTKDCTVSNFCENQYKKYKILKERRITTMNLYQIFMIIIAVARLIVTILNHKK